MTARRIEAVYQTCPQADQVRRIHRFLSPRGVATCGHVFNDSVERDACCGGDYLSKIQLGLEALAEGAAVSVMMVVSFRLYTLELMDELRKVLGH